MKNPHFTPAEELRILSAEKASAKATMLELGAAAVLKEHMPCTTEIETAIEVLQESLRLRATANAIHNSVGRHGRKGRPMRPKPA